MTTFERLKQFHAKLENRWLVYAWSSAALCVLCMWMFASTSVSTTFLGVAQSREIEIRYEHPVKIKRVLVVSGQRVKAGDPLVELDQQELSLKIKNAELHLAQLEAQRKQTERPSRYKYSNEDRQAAGQADPLYFEISRVDNELKTLKAQLKELTVSAPFDGTIGTVSFATGERVSPFTPVLTLARGAPTTVQGFVEESALSATALEQEVVVTSLTDPRKQVHGTIATLGARIVPFPQRLLVNSSLQIWGREVLVAIPEANPFLVGEKVKVVAGSDLALVSAARASVERIKK